MTYHRSFDSNLTQRKQKTPRDMFVKTDPFISVAAHERDIWKMHYLRMTCKLALIRTLKINEISRQAYMENY
jgi:hypothetical protein